MKRPRNRWYAFVTPREHGIVDSWEACDAKVSGKPARCKGFVDRASAERWLAEGARYDSSNRPAKFYAWLAEGDDPRIHHPAEDRASGAGPGCKEPSRLGRRRGTATSSTQAVKATKQTEPDPLANPGRGGGFGGGFLVAPGGGLG